MLVFYQMGWAFLVSTVFRTPRAIARRDIALLLGGSEASKRRWPPFSKAISIHVLALDGAVSSGARRQLCPLLGGFRGLNVPGKLYYSADPDTVTFEPVVKRALSKLPFTPCGTPNLCQLRVDEAMCVTSVWVPCSQISRAKGELTRQRCKI